MRHGKITGFMLSVVLLVGLWTASLAWHRTSPVMGGSECGACRRSPSLDMHQEQTLR